MYGFEEIDEKDLPEIISGKLKRNVILIDLSMTGGDKEIDIKNFLEKKDEEKKDFNVFMNGHYKGTKMGFLNKLERGRLKSIKNSLYRLLEDLSLSRKFHYISVDSLKIFNEAFVEAKREYLKIVESLEDRFPELLKRFKDNVYTYLEETIKDEKKLESIWKEVQKKIPDSKISFRGDFSFEYNMYMFRGIESPNMELDVEILEALRYSQESDTMKLTSNMFAKLASLTLAEACKFVRGAKSQTTDKALSRLKDFNFMESKDVEEWRKELMEAEKATSIRKQEVSEALIAKVWGFVKRNGLYSKIEIPFSMKEEYLDGLTELY